MTTTLVPDLTSASQDGRPCTKAVQAAVEEVARAGGGTVVIPPGRHVIGTVRLRSNVRLHVELGATLVGSPNIDDYEEEDEGFIPPEFPYVRCLFVGFDLENVEVTGGGTIDGSGAAFMDYSVPTFDETFTTDAYAAMPDALRHQYVSEHKAMRPTWIFFLRRCRGVRFRDVRIVDVARWTARFSLCENVQMTGLIIENDLRAANSDGMHFTGCRNVTISNCTITSGDDCIAVTTYGDDDAVSNGTVVTNCVLTSHSAGMRIGLGKNARIENINVSNCVFRACNRAVGVFAESGSAVRSVRMNNLQIDTRLIAGSWWGKAEPVIIATFGEGAVIEDLHLSDVTAHSQQGIIVYAAPGSTVRGISLSRIALRLSAGPMTPFAAGTLDIRPLLMERRKLAAIWAHGVERLVLRDVEVEIDPAAREAIPDVVEFRRCVGLSVLGLLDRSLP